MAQQTAVFEFLTLSDDAAVGTVAWLNPTQAKTDDSLVASAAQIATSHYLKALDPQVSFPAGARISGIEAAIKKAQNTTDSRDNIVRLVVAGIVSGNNKALGGIWPFDADLIPGTEHAYGDDGDFWGAIDQPFPEQVLVSNFGLVLSSINNVWFIGQFAGVNAMRMKFHYTMPMFMGM